MGPEGEVVRCPGCGAEWFEGTAEEAMEPWRELVGASWLDRNDGTLICHGCGTLFQHVRPHPEEPAWNEWMAVSRGIWKGFEDREFGSLEVGDLFFWPHGLGQREGRRGSYFIKIRPGEAVDQSTRARIFVPEGATVKKILFGPQPGREPSGGSSDDSESPEKR